MDIHIVKLQEQEIIKMKLALYNVLLVNNLNVMHLTQNITKDRYVTVAEIYDKKY